MPRPKKIQPVAAAVPESACTVVDPEVLRKLGVRYEQRMVTRQVQATGPDGRPAYTDRGPLMTMREMLENVEIRGNELNVAEAKQLGVQNWFPYGTTHMACKVATKEGPVRYRITLEDYAELCPASPNTSDSET